MQTLFISDLHLSELRPGKLSLFERFAASIGRETAALYILGDLFEFWHGDDDRTETNTRIMAALTRITGAGVPVCFQRGNRDFLIGNEFSRETGVEILPDYHVIDLYGRRALLMHGDLLCTDDIGYLRMRRIFSLGWLQWLFVRTPLFFRRWLSARVRNFSVQENAGKSPQIMDVSADSVVRVMRDHGVELLIHGHTHRPATHTVEPDACNGLRIVLGDWYSEDSVLVCRPGEQSHISINDFLQSR